MMTNVQMTVNYIPHNSFLPALACYIVYTNYAIVLMTYVLQCCCYKATQQTDMMQKCVKSISNMKRMAGSLKAGDGEGQKWK